MARRFRENQQRFDELSDAGAEYLWGSNAAARACPEVWLHRLLEEVAD